ncbi:MAG: hypothetical protein RL462_29 [Pseudomonadota bacterium]|jgi:hypothetical protein
MLMGIWCLRLGCLQCPMVFIQYIPPWVFLILAALLWLGLSARKDRMIRWRVPIIVPMAMTVMAITSLLGQYGATELLVPALLAWLSVCGLTGWKLAQRPLPDTFSYDAESAKFHLPGSYVPLALYMGIFAFKFMVGFMTGMRMPIVNELFFVLGISAIYGLFSGVFLSSAWRLLLLRQGA